MPAPAVTVRCTLMGQRTDRRPGRPSHYGHGAAPAGAPSVSAGTMAVAVGKFKGRLTSDNSVLYCTRLQLPVTAGSHIRARTSRMQLAS